jgi:REP element-mobilizing transposase RayT
MFRISKDSPAYYLTSVAKDRLPVFRKVNIQEIICKAITEARTSAGFLLFAYALMPDHLHAIVGSELKPSKVRQYIHGIISRRVIQFLMDQGHQKSLEKLRHEDMRRNYRYSLWDHHPNAKLLTSEDVFCRS